MMRTAADAVPLPGVQKKKPRVWSGLRRDPVRVGLGGRGPCPKRGVPDRGEHRQAAERAAADIKGHSEAAELG
jgi:hypothetical protein